MKSGVIKFASISLIVLGTVHLGFTPIICKDLSCLDFNNRLVFIFMFIATGIGIILPGIIVWLLIHKSDIITPSCGLIAYICSIETMVTGILAIITMFNNPFAYLMFIFGTMLFISIKQLVHK